MYHTIFNYNSVICIDNCSNLNCHEYIMKRVTDGMLSLEKLANANIKNRAEYTQLTTDLSRLEKEKQNELRMSNNEIQRFKAKYSKTNFNSDSPQASNVKMYETHNPGFCFKRDGSHRGQPTTENNSTIDFEHLHFLLFTDGEVDIEKILCLHLLSSHETDHLTPPRRPRSNSTFTKKDSPLEQIIERSDENMKEINELLPTYVIDVQKGNPKRTIMDERLSARLLVNEKILELILTVITALETSNPEKVRHLISIAEDPSSLKRIFRKQHIQDFVMTLKDHSLVNSCSSFILTQPYKIKPNHLEIRTTSGALEDLIRFIRSNVLQFPRPPSWTMLEVESRELVSIEQQPMAMVAKSSVYSARRSSFTKPSKLDVGKEARPDSSTRFRRRDTNFIKKNIESIPSYKRTSTDEEEIEETYSKRRSSDVGSRKSEKNEDEKTTSQSIESSKKLAGSRRSSRDSSRRSFGSKSPHSSRSNVGAKQEQVNQKEEIKVHLKQTKCPACMEKWKIPLPTPKVPTMLLKMNSISPNTSERNLITPVIKTNSMLRVSNLIEQEKYKLNSYDRRYSNASNPPLQPKKKSIQTSSLDLVALNVMDLEKIRHEIREKETQKKLEKFLNT